MNLDPLGHELYQSRLEQIPEILEAMLENTSAFHCKIKKTSRYCINGIGSSEAHAKFLVYLINEYTESFAEYLPTSYFVQPQRQFKDNSLIVFSQGLSANSRIVLEHSKLFQNTILFSAASEDKFAEYDVTHIPFPIADEYSILMRVIGPIAGYMAAIEFVRNNFTNNILPEPPEYLLDIIKRPSCALPQDLETQEGLVILANSPISLYGQNLVYKFTEGIFAKGVMLVDYLGFAHGPFQELMANPRPVIALKTNSGTDEHLLRKAIPLLDKIEAHTPIVEGELSHPYSILEFEAIFNYFTGKSMKVLNIDQRNWPGKDLDAPLYKIDKPL